MPRTANEDLSKIPKWAQNKIRSLEMQVENKDNHIRELSTRYPDTNTLINQNHVYPDKELEPFSHILFYLGGGRDRWGDAIEVSISRSDPERLQIQGSNKFLIIEPASYNSFYVRLTDR